MVALGTFLPWTGDKILGIGGRTASAFDISANVLWDTTPGELFFKLAYVFLILAGLALLASLVPRAAGLRRIAGVLTIVGVALYAVTALRRLNELDGLSVNNAFRIIAIGAFVTLVGGILLLLSPKRRVPAR
jgi:predicted membrane protein